MPEKDSSIIFIIFKYSRKLTVSNFKSKIMKNYISDQDIPKKQQKTSKLNVKHSLSNFQAFFLPVFFKTLIYVARSYHLIISDFNSVYLLFKFNF